MVADRRPAKLAKNVFNYVTVDVGQAEVSTLEAECQAFMVNAQQLHDCGLEVVDVNAVLRHVVAEVVGFAVIEATFDASTGHPQTEISRMVITTVASPVIHISLAKDCASEFAAPDHQGVFEQSSLSQILDQCR